MNWADIITKVSQDGGVSWTELMAMDIARFFIVIMNFENQIKERTNAMKRGRL